MSYYSSVAIVFDLTSLTPVQTTEAKNILIDLSGQGTHLKQNGVYLQLYNPLHQWSFDDPLIRYFYDFLDTLPPDSYSFMRTGEDNEDLEMQGSQEFGALYRFDIDPDSLPID